SRSLETAERAWRCSWRTRYTAARTIAAATAAPTRKATSTSGLKAHHSRDSGIFGLPSAAIHERGVKGWLADKRFTHDLPRHQVPKQLRGRPGARRTIQTW